MKLPLKKSNSIYIQTHFIADFQDMTANLFVGLRYEETEVHSEALVPLYDRVEWSIIDNRFNLFFQKDADDNTYHRLLRD